MDWTSVFDEVYPEPGATEAVIAQFVAEVGQPLSTNEIRGINAGQRNPFPKNNPQHDTFRPFDVAAWLIPNRPLPTDYISLLRWSNGGEFSTGERWFQLFPAHNLQHGVRSMLVGYHLPQYMPGAMPIAFNGGGTFYLFDMREPAKDGEYPVVCAAAGNLGWDPDDCKLVADSLIEACRGKADIDELLYG